MGVILPWRDARGMAIRSPEVLGARSCVHAHSVSVIYQSKKCAKHHEMPVGSLCRRPGSRHTKARWAQAELSVFEWRASNAAAPYVVRQAALGRGAEASNTEESSVEAGLFRHGANSGP